MRVTPCHGRMEQQLACSAEEGMPPPPLPATRLLSNLPRHASRPSFSKAASPRRSLRVRRLASERQPSITILPDDLVAKAAPEFQDDVARMLQQPPLHGSRTLPCDEPGTSPAHRARRRRPLSARLGRMGEGADVSTVQSLTSWLRGPSAGGKLQPYLLAMCGSMLLGMLLQVR